MNRPVSNAVWVFLFIVLCLSLSAAAYLASKNVFLPALDRFQAAQTSQVVVVPVVIESAVTPTSVGGTWVANSSSQWSFVYYDGATEQMHQWGADMRDLAPNLWRVFPNETNPLVSEFTPADGLEYGEDETGYCEQVETCDIVVPPLHYRIVTGDYILPFDSCKAEERTGCGFMMVNVGEVSTGLEDVSVDFGFTVWGRYFNGDAMPMAIWAGLSKTANNMLHLESELNPNPLPNAGGNCSLPTGCEKARLPFFIMSGNELLMRGLTTVSR